MEDWTPPADAVVSEEKTEWTPPKDATPVEEVAKKKSGSLTIEFYRWGIKINGRSCWIRNPFYWKD